MNRRLFNVAGSALVAATLAGCLSEEDPVTQVPFTSVAAGTRSGISTERFEVIRDEPTFSDLWSSHASGVAAAPAQPLIDFGNRMAVAVFLGTRSTSGYTIRINSVEEKTENLIVNVDIATPGINCGSTTATSEPFQMVTIPFSHNVVAFNTTVEVVGCP